MICVGLDGARWGRSASIPGVDTDELSPSRWPSRETLMARMGGGVGRTAGIKPEGGRWGGVVVVELRSGTSSRMFGSKSSDG